MSKQILIDSSVFLSSFIENDTHYKETRKFFDILGKTKISIILPSLVICEVLNILHRNGFTQLEKQILNFFQDEKVFISIPLDMNFIVNHYRSEYRNFSLKTSDSILAVACLSYHICLITLDKKLYQEVNKHCVAMTPVEFLHGLGT